MAASQKIRRSGSGALTPLADFPLYGHDGEHIYRTHSLDGDRLARPWRVKERGNNANNTGPKLVKLCRVRRDKQGLHVTSHTVSVKGAVSGNGHT